MKAVKVICVIGLLVLLIAFFIHMAAEWTAVKSVEPAIKNLPKIKKEMKQLGKDKEKQLDQESEAEENKKKKEPE
jgi:hypothetical protein